MKAIDRLDPERVQHTILTGETTRGRPTWTLVLFFAALFFIQVLGFLILGTGRAGSALSESILVIDNAVALICAWAAFRRSTGITALFWFLFCLVITILFVPTAIQAHDTILNRVTLSEANRGLLYCLYGAPVVMMLFLPEAHRMDRVQSEIALDFFLVAIVVSLVYSTFFFLPVQQMMPAAATLRNTSISDIQSLLLLIAGFLRLQFARVSATRDLLLRLTIFLMVCAAITFMGDWVYVHHAELATWFDLGWGIPVFAAALIGSTWKTSAEPEFPANPQTFLSFLGANLVLVAMLSSLALLADRWRQAYGGPLTTLAVAASLLALTLRLALTQFHQYQEIANRRTAQEELAASHQKVAGLLDYAHRQTAEITQINELSTLLQACNSRDEAFLVIPENLIRLFPRTSGTLSVFDPSRIRVETVAEWGACDAAVEKPQTHAVTASPERNESGSISIPLIAKDEPIGVLLFRVLNDSSLLSPFHASESARLRQLASAVAEHIALTISNLDLRAALHTQAIRDSLTGLHNRRYLKEALDRELYRARRRGRPLSVLMIDVDNFKRYNDTFGHAAGDNALRVVAEMLVASVRAEDLACRYGGEEFLVILPECPLSQAAARAEEIRFQLRELCLQRIGEIPEVVTVSIGVSGYPETTDKIDLLVKLADEALYQAKREGRDRVSVSGGDASDSKCSDAVQIENKGTAATVRS